MTSADGAAEKPTPDPTAYGQPISAERQAELQAMLDAWNAPDADHGERKGPFDGVRLTGADVCWLAEHSGPDEWGRVLNLHLERAALSEAQLERANLHAAQLEGADHTEAWLDSKTVLSGAVLDHETHLGDIQWSGVGAVNLTRITWGQVPTVGDEVGIDRTSAVEKYEAVVRAYRQLAAQLRAQGMSEVADRFAYRAQVRQRMTLWRQKSFLRWFGSWLLDRLAGYGFRPGRSLVIYLFFILGFAAVYFALGSYVTPALTPVDAAVFSLTSFHGRGFSPGGPGEPVTLHNPLTMLAALEAVIGLLIEISFIATFTQRFFGAK